MRTISLSSSNENIPVAVDFVEKNLKELKVPKKDITRAMLLTEETVAEMITSCTDISDISISLKKRGRNSSIIIRAKGSEFHFENSFPEFGENLGLDTMDEDSKYAISKLILKSYENRFSTKYRNGVNTITISSGKAEQSNLKKCGIAIVLAIVCGLLFRYLAPEDVNNFLSTKILGTITTVFMNALKMVTGPLIFFSLAACIGSFTDMKLLGRIGGKVMGFYLFTTCIAITIGIALFNCFSSVKSGDLLPLISDSTVVEKEGISLVDSLINIVPDNFFGAFVNSNTLQILFLAILVGIAATKLGNSSLKVADFFDGANELFMKIATLITKGLPLIVFSSICSLILSVDVENIEVLGRIILTLTSGYLIILTFYTLSVSIMTRTNPFKYIKKVFPAWLNAFSLSSSNAAMPTTMHVCDQNLKISKKVFSFSIPLGATINMDGTSIAQTFVTLTLAVGFGINFTASEYVALIISVILLSMSAPGIPGAGIAMLSILASQFSIPAEGVALASSILILLDPISTSCNVCGDIAGTYIVASREGLINNDKEK